MAELAKYRRRVEVTVVAVRLDLDTDGFTYRKWGAEQLCRAGDWLVNNAGTTYTVGATAFADAYREVSPGVFAKEDPVWVERAATSGTMPTKDGMVDFAPGDMLVFVDPDRIEGLPMSAEQFDEQYEPAERR